MNGIVAVVVEMFWIVFFGLEGRGDGCFSRIQEWKVLGSQKILDQAWWNKIY